jgi:hypothetical protein
MLIIPSIFTCQIPQCSITTQHITQRHWNCVCMHWEMTQFLFLLPTYILILRQNCPCRHHTAMKTCSESGHTAPQQFLTWLPDEGKWSASCHSCFITREIDPCAHCIGGWVHLQQPDCMFWRPENALPLPGFKPQSIMPLVTIQCCPRSFRFWQKN